MILYCKNLGACYTVSQ